MTGKKSSVCPVCLEAAWMFFRGTAGVRVVGTPFPPKPSWLHVSRYTSKKMPVIVVRTAPEPDGDMIQANKAHSMAAGIYDEM